MWSLLHPLNRVETQTIEEFKISPNYMLDLCTWLYKIITWILLLVVDYDALLLKHFINAPLEFYTLAFLTCFCQQIGVLKKELESVRKHRKQYRNRRLSVPVPVVSLVSGKIGHLSLCSS